jgi:flagellar hook protein FlgE
MGSLESFSLGNDGTITGVYSNGLRQSIGQLAMASFNNPGGLEKAGNSSFRVGDNSGAAAVGQAGTGGRGVLNAGALEMSNVDLAEEFTGLIVAQRGFQANSRVITSSDEILQDLVNLKR